MEGGGGGGGMGVGEKQGLGGRQLGLERVVGSRGQGPHTARLKRAMAPAETRGQDVACNFRILGYCSQHSAQKSSLDFPITPRRRITSVGQKKGRPKKARKKAKQKKKEKKKARKKLSL